MTPLLSLTLASLTKHRSPVAAWKSFLQEVFVLSFNSCLPSLGQKSGEKRSTKTSKMKGKLGGNEEEAGDR